MYDADRLSAQQFISDSRKIPNQDDRERELRLNDEVLLDYLRKLGVDSNPQIIRRLMLLDTRRRSLGKRVEIIEGTDKEGRAVEKRIGTHLEHTLKLAGACELFSDIFSEDWKKRNLLKVKSASILHDIGKTGGLNNTPQEQKTFTLLFSFFEPDYEMGKRLKEATIGETIERHSLPEEKESMLASLPGLGLSPDQKMSEVFGRHVDYTYEILKSTPGIDPEILYIASSHHNGLRNYPYQLKDEELESLLPDDEERAKELREAAKLLEISDVFEALLSRGQIKDPSEVIDELINLYNRASQRDGRDLSIELDMLNKIKTMLAKLPK